MSSGYRSRWSLFFLASVFAANVSYSLEPKQIAQRSFPSVVVLESIDETDNVVGVGSGFAVAPNLICTNIHVIAKANRIRIRELQDQRELAVEGYTAEDTANDLVLLSVKGGRLHPIQIGDDTALVVGDSVYAIGNPLGLEGTFSSGMLSARRELDGRTILQITAPISPGNSGGPVLNADAELVGITIAYLREGQNLNFACPSSILRKIMASQHKLTPLEPSSFKDESSTLTHRSNNGELIQIGKVLISLGTAEQDAVSLLGQFYALQRMPVDSLNRLGVDSSYVVQDISNVNNNGSRSSIGSIHFKDGKVARVGIDHGEIEDDKSAAQVLDFYRFLAARVGAGQTECTLKVKSSQTRLDSGKQLHGYCVRFVFQDRDLSLTITEFEDGGLWTSLTEHIPALPDPLPDR